MLVKKLRIWMKSSKPFPTNAVIQSSLPSNVGSIGISTIHARDEFAFALHILNRAKRSIATAKNFFRSLIQEINHPPDSLPATYKMICTMYYRLLYHITRTYFVFSSQKKTVCSSASYCLFVLKYFDCIEKEALLRGLPFHLSGRLPVLQQHFQGHLRDCRLRLHS